MKLALKNSTLVWLEKTVCIGLFWLSGCQLQPPSSDSQAIGKETRPDAPTVNRQVVDANASLGSEIMRSFSREPKLQGSSIGVSVSNVDGSIILMGTVRRAEQKKQALQIAEKVAKKKNKSAKIWDKLRVQASIPLVKAKSKVINHKP